MKRYLVVEASAHEGPPIVVGFFDDLNDVTDTTATTAIELETGRVFEIEWICREWRESDAVTTD